MLLIAGAVVLVVAGVVFGWCLRAHREDVLAVQACHGYRQTVESLSARCRVLEVACTAKGVNVDFPEPDASATTRPGGVR